MTTGERLALLSGLSGVSAGEHLKKLAGSIGLAGALLLASSGLPDGTAQELLLAGPAPIVAPVTNSGGGGGGRINPIAKQLLADYQQHDNELALQQQIQQEDDILIMAVAHLITLGAFG